MNEEILKRGIAAMADQGTGIWVALSESERRYVDFLNWAAGVGCWTPFMTDRAWVLVQKFAQQVAGAVQVNVQALKRTTKGAPEQSWVAVHGTTFVAWTPWGRKDLDGPLLRKIPSASMQPVPHWHWVLPRDGRVVQGLLDLIGLGEIYVGDGVLAALDEIVAEGGAVLPTRSLVIVGGEAQIRFERDPKLIEDVKGLVIPRKRWVPGADGHWAAPVTPDSAHQLLAFASRWQVSMEPAVVQTLEDTAAKPARFIRVQGNHMVVGTVEGAQGESQFIRRIPTAQEVTNDDNLKVFDIRPTPLTINMVQGLASDPRYVVASDFDAACELWLDTWEFELTDSESKEADLPQDLLARLGGELRPYQRAGVLRTLRLGRAMGAVRKLLGDDMGIGKTPQAAAIMEALNVYPVVVACPAPGVWTIQDMLTTWLPQRSTEVLNGQKPQPGDYTSDIIIVPYSILAHRVANGMVEALTERGLGMVVFDESHKLANYTTEFTAQGQRVYSTKRVAAAYALAQPCQHRLMLSGTSATNGLGDFAAQLDILGYLKPEFGGMGKYLMDWCDTDASNGWGRGGRGNIDQGLELNAYLRTLCMTRRRREDVQNQTPPLVWAQIPLHITNRATYKQAETDVIQWLVDQIENDTHFLNAIRTLDPLTQRKLITDRQQEESGRARNAQELYRINKLRLLAAQGILGPAIEWVEEWLEAQPSKILIFAEHVEIQKALIAAFPGCARLIGDDSAVVKQHFAKQFSEDPSVRVCVASIGVASEVYTLHGGGACHTVAFVEYPWTPGKIDQAAGRVDRYGQIYGVTAYQLVATATIHERMLALINEKRKLLNAALNGEASEVEAGGLLKALVAGLLKEKGVVPTPLRVQVDEAAQTAALAPAT